MGQVIERRNQSERVDRLDHPLPSIELQFESSTYARLSKEMAEKTRELRQLRGEELQGLDLKELKRIEKLLEGGLSRVTQTKDERFFKEISTLKKKGVELMEENRQLKKQKDNFPCLHEAMKAQQQGQASDSTAHTQNSALASNGYDNFDISLRLGLPFPNYG